MTKLTRNDIQIINKHADWEEREVDAVLQKNVYVDKEEWNSILRILFLVFGLGFVSIGIMFFFAYNWDDLSKTGKLITVEVVVALSVALYLFFRKKAIYANIMATSVSFLIGVMFAVFGQIYQTGANAYDFFFNWAMAITIIVLLSDFAVLWFLYLLLLVTTWHFYFSQVISGYHELYELFGIFLFYLSVFVITHFLKNANRKIPNWWMHSTVLIITAAGTLIVGYNIVESGQPIFEESVTNIVIFVAYILGVLYAIKQKYIVPFALIIFSCILLFTTFIISCILLFTTFIIRSTDDFAATALVVSLFLMLSVTGLVYQIVSLQKKWANE
ncbi:DUF2157 domain-containing protein [Flammeovirga aprica]|uniref:DUF2157 domain-containing protein n=1 Tax=Flammeovirga aprica JL-4 TaxID=694437 RepID=A0A7X9X9V4_9BACT|nr:DUF2157 domain-containing protein [Flammeovirga aprica]NME69115.1 DUF2157 domain-containing protein [Flammeovirga aprica JL-4]